jgi:hypothetical protein
MRSRLLFVALLVILPVVALASSTLPVSFTQWPLAIREPGSLLLLGIAFLILAAIAQRAIPSERHRETGADTTG